MNIPGLDAGLEEARAQRTALATDPHRPRYHFLAPSGWMNDPHGLIQWQGRYHLFYQHNPHAAYHDRIHWGHAVSDDLVHWRDWPIALAPTPGGPDEHGCWSGCTVDNDGTPTLFYTATMPQVVSMATSQDGLRTWRKHPDNPLIAGPPAELNAGSGGHFRDPFVWREDGRWWMLVGCKSEGAGGMILLYRSHDLEHWQFSHPLLVGDLHQAEPFWTGTMWECPSLLNFGRRHTLIFSVQATPTEHLYPVYYTGAYSNQQFEPQVQGILTQGGYFYAPTTARLDDGRHVMLGWIREGRSQRLSDWAGWAGAISLPLTLSLDEAGHIRLAPLQALQRLRGRHQRIKGLSLAAGQTLLLEGVGGACLEIVADLRRCRRRPARPGACISSWTAPCWKFSPAPAAPT